MVAKVLLTLLVLLIACIYLKRRTLSRQGSKQSNPFDHSRVNPVGIRQRFDPIKVVAAVFVLVCFVLTLSVFAYHWYDGHQRLKVTLISPQSSQPLYYQVYKSALQERSFTTTTGQIIRIGSQDRLQIEPLTD